MFCIYFWKVMKKAFAAWILLEGNEKGVAAAWMG
jgi:hypothetical protein